MRAFERELLELLPRLRRFARALTGDAADADDLCQAALEKAIKARDRYERGTRLDAWMYRIMRNSWIDEVRARQRRGRHLAPEEAGERIGDEGHRDIEHKAMLRDVERAMARLTPEQREAVALVLVEGLAYKDAAGILDIPMGTLTSRLTRGRQALAEMLETA